MSILTGPKNRQDRTDIYNMEVIMKKLYVILATVLLASLLAFPGCAAQNPPAVTSAAPLPSPTPQVISSSPLQTSQLDIETVVERIYTEVSPSVVNIRVVQKQQVMFPSFPEIPGFPQFNLPIPQGPREYYSAGLGSGFVWDTDGDIVTNNHVVSGADRISVTFNDGTTVAGKVVGTDPDSDLAVVKVDVPAAQLKPVQLADSTQVMVGQLAVAIGNPFGLEGTMTVGFVSALGRLLPADSQTAQGTTYSIPDVIQTDAAVNPGNSGGVLVDRNGMVIGVTSAIETSSGSNSGIGFAIPSAVVQKVVPVLIKSGHYEHAWLGISGESLNPDIAKAMGLPQDQRGALIIDITPSSPADKAGLHGSDKQVTIDGEQVRIGGDIITGINGQPVKTFDDVVTYLARSAEVGQTISLTILSGGKTTSVNVKLAARPTAQK
jgi:serine protease Do